MTLTAKAEASGLDDIAAIFSGHHTLLDDRDEQAAEEPQASRLKENLSLITLIVMMAISWGLEQFNHPFGQLAFIATTLVGRSDKRSASGSFAFVIRL